MRWDGALGFWAALGEVYPDTRHQCCGVHKSANVLNELPKSQQSKAMAALHEIWIAATRAEAIIAFDTFLKTYQAKYPKAADKLIKDRDTLLASYDFPAEHWIHLAHHHSRSSRPFQALKGEAGAAPDCSGGTPAHPGVWQCKARLGDTRS